MSGKVYSVIETGLKGTFIEIECHTSQGLPAIVIVGFANKAIDEAKERLRGAFSNSKLQLPRRRITINLAPADIPKDGAGFDLAIATAILLADKQIILPSHQQNSLFLGELGLDGSVRPIRGIIGKLLAARQQGGRHFFIPSGNLAQALLIPGIELFPVSNLRDIYMHFTDTTKLQAKNSLTHKLPPVKSLSVLPDFKEIAGQKRAKRAMEIAAAGGHNILLSGPPGTGKSMLGRALPSILPPLSPEEMLEVTHLHSLASRQFDQIITERPFRTPHHSASDIAIIGGSHNPRPGEISLSHRGVLFFDELPEFSRTTLEALRQPLEDGAITITRAKDSLTYPADFILVATSNPCPCGYYGSSQPCQCLPYQILRYQRKLSGPIMDRIDLYVDVDTVDHHQLLAKSADTETSQTIQNRVQQARLRQHDRFDDQRLLNSNMTNRTIKNQAKTSVEAQDLLNQAARQLNLSARGYMRTIKVARTIADLAACSTIMSVHISEALQYRPLHYVTKY